jgi:hypothetical protein
MGNRVELADSSGAAITGTNPLAVVPQARSATGTLSSVNSGIASVTILAANTSRRGATITNTDANVLYLDLSGGTASATSFTVPVASNGYFEVPYGYTGLITGIWAGDGSGAAKVTEFT